MKKLLTGVCNNIDLHIEKILLWKHSFEHVTTDGDVILVVYNPSEKDINVLNEHNIKHIRVTNNTSETVNRARIDLMIELFRDKFNDYSKIIYTDVFDVMFRQDPFNKLDYKHFNLFVGGEGIDQFNCPWNTDVMNKCFPEYVKILANKEVYCSGVIAGTPLSLTYLFSRMSEILLTSKRGHDIDDQAALNIILHNNTTLKLKLMNLLDNWVVHLASGGYQPFFETWGLKNAILKKYGIIPDWKNFDVVHQFNRMPEVHSEIKKLFN